MATTLALMLAAGFIIGRYTSPREPFYFIGTPIDPRSGRILSVEQNEAAAADNDTAAFARADATITPASVTETICGARTKAGKPCRRKVRGGGYCWQHRKQKESEARKAEGGGR